MKDNPIAPSNTGPTRLDLSKGLLAAVAHHARHRPHATACVRVRPSGDGFEEDTMSYGELVTRSRRFAAWFREHGVGAGDRLLFSVGDPRNFAACLLGTMSLGAVAVPLQTADEFGSAGLFRERMRTVACDCNPSLVVVEDHTRWQQTMQQVRLGIDTVSMEEAVRVSPPGDDECLLVDRSADEWAFIQYTSGSTGNPQGVVVTYGNLIANLVAIKQATATTNTDRFVSWLPLHHDMGLVGCLLFPIYWGIPTYLMSPMSFIAEPVSWLRAMSQFRGTVSVAPNFAYSLSYRKIPEDQLKGLHLSNWRLAFCGAEPIDAAVIHGFVNRFKPHGFRPRSFFPVYGLAEATLAVSFPVAEHVPIFDYVDRDSLTRGTAQPATEQTKRPLVVVSVGGPLPAHSLRIVDPETGQECAERQVGEVYISGPSVSPFHFMRGGFRPERRKEFRTGDLGYIADNQLYIVDRIKDLVVVAGQNYAPSDIEAVAAETPGVRLGRVIAFSLPGGEGTERVCIVAELDPTSWKTQRDIKHALATTISEHFGLETYAVVLVPPHTLPRTSSGKLRRRACRERYLKGELRPSVSVAKRSLLKLRRITGRTAGKG